MTTRQAKIQEDIHFRIMLILQGTPDMTQREMAEELGISVGGLNYCLKALIDKGFVKVQNFSNSKNKFRYVYLLTPMGIAEKVALATRFFSRKMEEYEALKSEVDALGQDKAQKSMIQVTTPSSSAPVPACACGSCRVPVSLTVSLPQWK
jgi:EPS-associated MarR family transcriptional regulator